MSHLLQNFIELCIKKIGNQYKHDYPDVLITDFMNLVANYQQWITSQYLQCQPNNFSRNLVYVDQNEKFAIYVLVWLQGYYSPIHDHKTWGMMGVLEGSLSEESFYLNKVPFSQTDNIKLASNGKRLLSANSISMFSAGDNYIHKMGNHDKMRGVSLHIYGNMLKEYYEYNLIEQTRTWQVIDD